MIAVPIQPNPTPNENVVRATKSREIFGSKYKGGEENDDNSLMHS